MIKIFLVAHSWVTASVFALIIIAMFACNTSRRAVYFNNFTDSAFVSEHTYPEPVIQKNDLLSITVSSLNPKATELFNDPNFSGAKGNESGTSESIGYLVGNDGTIIFPIIGKVKAEGLTKDQFVNSITTSLVKQELLIDPIVNVRFLNFKITVLGEVARPAVVNVPSERITILEAIGLAGDLTIYGRKDNVTLIREEDGKKVVRRLNLNSGDIFLSPYYYLKSNDIIYAEPNKSKIGSTNNSRQFIPILLSALSLLAIIVTQLK